MDDLFVIIICVCAGFFLGYISVKSDIEELKNHPHCIQVYVEKENRK